MPPVGELLLNLSHRIVNAREHGREVASKAGAPARVGALGFEGGSKSARGRRVRLTLRRVHVINYAEQLEHVLAAGRTVGRRAQRGAQLVESLLDGGADLDGGVVLRRRRRGLVLESTAHAARWRLRWRVELRRIHVVEVEAILKRARVDVRRVAAVKTHDDGRHKRGAHLLVHLARCLICVALGLGLGARPRLLLQRSHPKSVSLLIFKQTPDRVSHGARHNSVGSAQPRNV